MPTVIFAAPARPFQRNPAGLPIQQPFNAPFNGLFNVPFNALHNGPGPSPYVRPLSWGLDPARLLCRPDGAAWSS
jgi:hypothetical protein